MHYYRKTEDYGNFITNIALEAVYFRKNNYLEVLGRTNKTFGYFVLISSALGSKTEATKMDKTKIIIAMEVLNKVLVEFLKTKEFINEK